jgi:hypothetical protein
MSMIGRNDPCYCGSGKKYKKCCLHKEEQTREVSFHQEGLIKFALENFQAELAARTSEHIKKYPVGKDQEQTYANIAVCWEVFCSEIKDGKTPAELYVDRVKNAEKSEVAKILSEWTKAVPSLYKVIGQKNALIFTVQDIWTEQIFDVTINAAEKPKADSALLGTLVSNGINYEFYVGYVEMPISELPPLKEAIEKLHPLASASKIFKTDFPAVLQLSLIDMTDEVPAPSVGQKSESTAKEADVTDSDESDEKDEKYLAVTELVKANAETEVVKEAEKLWSEYFTESKPAIRKEEIYAAALDYLVSKDIAGKTPTQAETAKKYGVSPASLSSRYREMKERLSV